MNVKFERLPQANNSIDGLVLSNEQLAAIEKDYLTMPLKSNGSYGPITWNADFCMNFQDLSKSYAYIELFVFGINIIDGRLDAANPKISVALNVAGCGVKGTVGIDFDKCNIYFNGSINFFYYINHYDFTILSF